MAQREGMLERLSRWLGLGGKNHAAEEEVGVTWMLLPPYDIPGMAVIGGLLVENQGNDDAEAVYISLIYPTERFITHMEVVSDEPYRLQGGGPRDSYLTVELDCLHAGKKVVVWVAGHSVQTPEVTVALQAFAPP